MAKVIDTTLREGGQTAGITFSLHQKLAIVGQLVSFGVDEIELGVVNRYDRQLAPLVERSRRLRGGTAFSLWSLCRKDDIAYAAELESEVLSLSVPVSDLHIQKKLAKDRSWVLNTIKEAVAYAKDLGVRKISLGLEDATRADRGFLTEVLCCAETAGVFRVRLADTVGVMTPWELTDLVSYANEQVELEIGVHCHNDFGMATANSLAALESGAEWADTTVLGLGERAGNARLEEVASFLVFRRGAVYQMEKISKLSSYVSRITERSIDPQRPIVGHNIFTCESGLHLLGLEQNPSTYEPFHPAKVGQKRRLVYGAKIGRKNLQNQLSTVGIVLKQGTIDEAFEQFKDRVETLGRPLEKSELTGLCLS